MATIVKAEWEKREANITIQSLGLAKAAGS